MSGDDTTGNPFVLKVLSNTGWHSGINPPVFQCADPIATNYQVRTDVDGTCEYNRAKSAADSTIETTEDEWITTDTEITLKSNIQIIEQNAYGNYTYLSYKKNDETCTSGNCPMVIASYPGAIPKANKPLGSNDTGRDNGHCAIGNTTTGHGSIAGYGELATDNYWCSGDDRGHVFKFRKDGFITGLGGPAENRRNSSMIDGAEQVVKLHFGDYVQLSFKKRNSVGVASGDRYYLTTTEANMSSNSGTDNLLTATTSPGSCTADDYQTVQIRGDDGSVNGNRPLKKSDNIMLVHVKSQKLLGVDLDTNNTSRYTFNNQGNDADGDPLNRPINQRDDPFQDIPTGGIADSTAEWPTAAAASAAAAATDPPATDPPATGGGGGNFANVEYFGKSNKANTNLIIALIIIAVLLVVYAGFYYLNYKETKIIQSLLKK